MALSLTRLVTIVYASLNAALTLFVSILGLIYVRDEIAKRKELMKNPAVKLNITVDAEEDHAIIDDVPTQTPLCPEKVRKKSFLFYL